MKTTITLDAVTKAVDVNVNLGAGMITINDLRIAGMSGRALRTLRNVLISAVGFPEGQDLDEIDMDDDGLAEACDKIAAHITINGGVR